MEVQYVIRLSRYRYPRYRYPRVTPRLRLAAAVTVAVASVLRPEQRGGDRGEDDRRLYRSRRNVVVW
jgi:hypothetical protein